MKISPFLLFFISSFRSQKVSGRKVDRIVVEESRVVIQHVVPTGAVRLQTEQQPV
jgi:hypothetical protein